MYASIGTLIHHLPEVAQGNFIVVLPKGNPIGDREKAWLERFEKITVEINSKESFPLRIAIFTEHLTLEPNQGGNILVSEQQPDLPSSMTMIRNCERRSVTFVDDAKSLTIYESPGA